MNKLRKAAGLVFAGALYSLVLVSLPAGALAQAAQSAPKALGTVKTIDGNSIVLNTDNGATVKVQVQDSTRLLRVAPGQDLKEASPLSLQDLQPGDRILVRGKIGDSDTSLTASTLIAMKKADIAQKQQRDLQDWQHRGTGGLVKSVDTAAGTITVSSMTAAGSKTITIKTAKNTVVRRYSPDSIKFDDAKVSTIADIKPGDQLRARGNKSPDGSEMIADEIVSGTFRNVAGLVTAIDTSKGTVTVNDLATKKPVTVRVTSDSQMHKLPQPVAQRLALRLKGGAPGEGNGNGNGTGAPLATRPEGQHSAPSAVPAATGGGAGPSEGGPRPGGDLAQMLNHMPPLTLAEIAKGDAVMIVTTAGSATTDATAISLLDGVEPLLTAPNAASVLTPWSLGTGGAEAAAAGPQ